MPNQTERMAARRERALTALDAYQVARGDAPDQETDIQDLITDLLRLRVYKQRDKERLADEATRMARVNFNAEQAGEP